MLIEEKKFMIVFIALNLSPGCLSRKQRRMFEIFGSSCHRLLSKTHGGSFTQERFIAEDQQDGYEYHFL